MHQRLLILLACASLAGCTCGSLPGRHALRPAELAGRMYPDDAAELTKLLDEAMAGAEPLDAPVRALLVPHDGLHSAAKIAGQGWGAVRHQRYDRVVLLAQTHARRYAGTFLPAEGGYQTPVGPLLVDEDAIAQLERFPGLARRAAPFDGENSVELLLPWIARLWPHARVVPVLVGRIDDAGLAQVAEALRSILDERTLLAVSSDFAHSGERFGTRLMPPGLDARAAEAAFLEAQRPVFEALEAGDEAALVTAHREKDLNLCSRNAARLLLRLVGGESKPLLNARGSSIGVDFRQDDGNAVGYAAMAFGGRWPSVPDLGSPAREALARLTRESLEAAAAGRAPPKLADLPPRLAAPGGALLTLEPPRPLRLSMGRLYAERLADAARGAAVEFIREGPALRPEELATLDFELSVLGPPMPIEDPLDFEPGRHGLLLRKGDATGLLLPQVATRDGLDREGFLRALATSAGLAPDDWRDAELERFGVEVVPVPAAPRIDASAGTAPRQVPQSE